MEATLYQHSEQKQSKPFAFWLSVATLSHMALLLGLLFYQQLSNRKKEPPAVLNVMLVSLPSNAGNSALKAPVLDAPKQPDGVTAKEPSGTHVSSSAVPVPATQPKAPTPKVPATTTPPSSTVKKVAEVPTAQDRQQQMNQALERLKQKVGKSVSPAAPTTPKATPSELAPSASNSLTQALAQLKARVTKSGQPAANNASTVAATATSSNSGTTANSTTGILSPASYKAKAAAIIQENWAFSNPMLRGDGMEARVRIHLLADGTIDQIIFDQRAASEYLNNSIKRALEKSSPLPTPPQELRGRWIGFLFTPEGVQR